MRVCAARADCHVPQQALTTWEAKTVDAGKETAKAWSNVWNGKVQANKNIE